MLCSTGELAELQSLPLVAAVLAESARLARLHALLFCREPPEEPVVSLESFTWAHCLVRSRALELTAAGDEVGCWHLSWSLTLNGSYPRP